MTQKPAQFALPQISQKPLNTPETRKKAKNQKKGKKRQKPATFYIWQIAKNERDKNEQPARNY
jgi:hypothetical protein